MFQFNIVKELPAFGYLYNNVCNDVTCAGMALVKLLDVKILSYLDKFL